MFNLKISFWVPQGTLPWQPSFVGSIHRVEFRRQSADGVSLRQKALLTRWTQAASGAAGRAKRRALPCVCLQTVCCVGGRLWCCDDDDYSLIYQISYDNFTRASAAFWLGVQCPLAAWGGENFITTPPVQKAALFACFRLFTFSSIFPGGQLTPFAPMCGRPCNLTIILR